MIPADASETAAGVRWCQFLLDTTIKSLPKDAEGNETTLGQPPVQCDNSPLALPTSAVMLCITQMVYAKRGEAPELAESIEVRRTPSPCRTSTHREVPDTPHRQDEDPAEPGQGVSVQPSPARRLPVRLSRAGCPI